MEAKEGSRSEAEKKHTTETNASEAQDHPETKTEQPDSVSVEDPNPSVKAKKGTNYSRDEIKKLLNLIQDILPVTESDWEALTTKFNENCSFNRTSGSLKYNQSIKKIQHPFSTSFFSLFLLVCVCVC